MDEIIYCLAVYLNGIYCFLIETKESLGNGSNTYRFSNKAIKNLKAILQDLDQNLDFRHGDNFDFLRNHSNNQVLVNIVNHLEISFQLNCRQNQFFALETIPALQGEFSLHFSDLQYKISTFLLAEEEEFDLYLDCKKKLHLINILIISKFKAVEVKETKKCRKCLNQLVKKTYPDEEKKEILECSCCKKILDEEGIYSTCTSESCNFKYCNICSFQINESLNHCFFCSKNINGKNQNLSEKKINCSLCLKEFPESLLYSFDTKKPMKICYLCSQNAVASLKTDVLIENQRLWKGNWLDCPVLPSGL